MQLLDAFYGHMVHFILIMMSRTVKGHFGMMCKADITILLSNKFTSQCIEAGVRGGKISVRKI